MDPTQDFSTESTTPVVSAPTAPAILLPASPADGVNVVKKGSGGPKIKWGKGAKAMLAGSILALVLLVGGIIGGTKLSQQPQRPKVQADGGCCGGWDCGSSGGYCAGANCHEENGQLTGWGYCTGGESNYTTNYDRSAPEIASDYVEASRGQDSDAAQGNTPATIVVQQEITQAATGDKPNLDIGDKGVLRFLGAKDYQYLEKQTNQSIKEEDVWNALSSKSGDIYTAVRTMFVDGYTDSNNVPVPGLCKTVVTGCEAFTSTAAASGGNFQDVLNGKPLANVGLPSACFTDGKINKDNIQVGNYPVPCRCYYADGSIRSNSSTYPTGVDTSINCSKASAFTKYTWTTGFAVPASCVAVRYECESVAGFDPANGCNDNNHSTIFRQGDQATFNPLFCGYQQMDVKCGLSTGTSIPANSYDAFYSIYNPCGVVATITVQKATKYCGGLCGNSAECSSGLSCQSVKLGGDTVNQCWGDICGAGTSGTTTTFEAGSPTPTPTAPPGPTPTPPGSSFQCQQIQILRGGVVIAPSQILLNDNIVFRGFASATGTTVSSMLFTITINGVAQTPVSLPATLVGGQYQADYPYTISQATSYSASVSPVSP